VSQTRAAEQRTHSYGNTPCRRAGDALWPGAAEVVSADNLNDDNVIVVASLVAAN
jgi:hypothetical protein